MQTSDLPLFCQYCGSAVMDVSEGVYYRGMCSQCGRYVYMQYKVSIAAIIIKDGKILLLQRAQEPWKGSWNTPAGYLEYEESIVDGVKREVFEEAGLIVEVQDLHHVIKYDNDPRGHGIVLFYNCEIIEGEYIPNDEVQEMRFFSANELPDRIAGGGHNDIVEILKQEGRIHDS